MFPVIEFALRCLKRSQPAFGRSIYQRGRYVNKKSHHEKSHPWQPVVHRFWQTMNLKTKNGRRSSNSPAARASAVSGRGDRNPKKLPTRRFDVQSTAASEHFRVLA